MLAHPLSRTRCIKSVSWSRRRVSRGSSPAAIPRLKSGALEIDHGQLADSG